VVTCCSICSNFSGISTTGGKSSGSDGQPEEFKKILKKIDEDFCLIQKLSDIESARFISASTLNRWFKKYTNLSPKEFIETKKLYYAARLLASGAGVTDACMQSGFSDCSHFIALFKKKFGETPLKYKKRYEGDFFLTLEKTNDL
jgi:AraC-like DNA-binding protein